METLNSLYLELSTVCEVKTHRETVLEDLLGSVRAIALRKGKHTDWPVLASVLKQEGIETNFQFNFESFGPAGIDECITALAWLVKAHDAYTDEADEMAAGELRKAAENARAWLEQNGALQSKQVTVPYTNCCGMDPATCDCVKPDHGKQNMD